MGSDVLAFFVVVAGALVLWLLATDKEVARENAAKRLAQKDRSKSAGEKTSAQIAAERLWKRFLESNSPLQRAAIVALVVWSLAFWFGGSKWADYQRYRGDYFADDLRSWVWPVGFVCIASYFLAGMQKGGRNDS